MARERVGTFSLIEPTLRRLDRGGALLVSVDAAGRPNAMTIGWLSIGVIWGQPICTVYVRGSRYTDAGLRAAGEFSVAVLGDRWAEALSYCGSHSGRDGDKLAACGLTASMGVLERVPVLDQAVIAYECRVVHATDVRPETLSPSIIGAYYPKDDFHHIYHGRIVAVTAEPGAAGLLA